MNDRISKCQKILEQDPNSQIFAALAEGYRKNGDLDKAFRTCQGGLRIHPSYGSAHVVMAKINLDRGLYDWAEAEVKKAIELDGTSRAIELLMAEIHIYRGEFNEAVKLLKKLHQLDPANSQIKKLLDIAVKLPEEQKAGKAEKVAKVVQTEARKQAPETEPPPPDNASLTIKEVLQKAMSLPEIHGALFVDQAGLVVESEWAAEMNATTCGATFADLERILSKELVESSFGKSTSILIENSDFLFYLIRVESGMFLFAGDAATNLGGLRMKIGSFVDRHKVN